MVIFEFQTNFFEFQNSFFEIQGLFLLIHTYSLCRVEPVVRFPARGLT